MTASEAESVTFRTALRGYRLDEVDAFLDAVVATLRSHESASGQFSGRLSGLDVEQVTFSTALRGYDLSDVDDFLGRLVVTLKGYESETRESRRDVASSASVLEAEIENSSEPPDSNIKDASTSGLLSSDEILAQAKKRLK